MRIATLNYLAVQWEIENNDKSYFLHIETSP